MDRESRGEWTTMVVRWCVVWWCFGCFKPVIRSELRDNSAGDNERQTSATDLTDELCRVNRDVQSMKDTCFPGEKARKQG